MRRVTVPFVLCILMMVSLPAAAQKTEWRFALRLTALDMNAETESIFDTGTSMVSDGTKPTFNFEGQYMVAKFLNVWLGYEYVDRSSDDLNDFQENRVNFGLTLSYGL